MKTVLIMMLSVIPLITSCEFYNPFGEPEPAAPADSPPVYNRVEVNDYIRSMYDFAVDEGGYLYISESGTDGIRKISPTWQTVASWSNDMSTVRNISTDLSGNVFFLAYEEYTYNMKVFRYGTNGTFLLSWGEEGYDPGEFASPSAIAADPDGFVFVSDREEDRIQKFAYNGDLIRWWGRPGIGDGEFRSPTDLAVGPKGNVFVCDANNYRIQKFTTDGVFVTKWGEEGSEDGQFRRPDSIAVDHRGNVFVGDPNRSNIQQFDSDGGLVSVWSGPNLFSSPTDLAVDAEGRLYVLNGHTLEVFRLD